MGRRRTAAWGLFVALPALLGVGTAPASASPTRTTERLEVTRLQASPHHVVAAHALDQQHRREQRRSAPVATVPDGIWTASTIRSLVAGPGSVDPSGTARRDAHARGPPSAV